MYYYLIIMLTIIVLAGLFCYYKRDKEFLPQKGEKVKAIRQKKEENYEEQQQPVVHERLPHTSHNLSRQYIRLLGSFVVKDKHGEDITNLFTQKLRLLLTLLILGTEDDPNGISGDVISEILWPGKHKYAARNNRNVSISKLRILLESVGGISILNQGNYWKMVFDEDVLCDYAEIMIYYRNIKQNKLKDEFHTNLLLHLLQPGALLNQVNIDWVTYQKGLFSYQTVEILGALLAEPSITNDELKIKIADALLQHDGMNEYAIRIKCMLLDQMGKTKAMELSFNEFCINYANLLGVKYEKTLKEVLEEEEVFDKMIC